VNKVLYLFAFMALLLITFTSLLRATKAMRGKRGALTTRINLDDLFLLLGLCVLISALMAIDNRFFSLLIASTVGLYGLLVWLDAVLFVQYRIEINRQTIAWFLTGSKGLGKGIPHLLVFFKQYPIAAFIPVVWLAVTWTAFSANNIQQAESLYPLVKVTLCSLMLTALCVYFSKVNLYGVIASIFSMASIIVVPLPVLSTVIGQGLLWFAASIFGLVMTTTLLLMMLRKLFHSQHEFLSSPSLLGNILADDNFVANGDIAVKPEHIEHVEPKVQSQIKSPFYGQCSGANVILITVESLGAYINPYIADGARSRIAEKLANKSWFSKQHFCLCPNTTVSTNQMYTGAYSNNPYNKLDSLFPGSEPKHLNALKAKGYKTLFLDSANTDLFDYKKLLNRIGFDRVWGTADIPAMGLQADYRLWNMVDVIAKEVSDSPFFLHVINDQTHMPYEVVDKHSFCYHKGKSQKALYLNAMEEVDYILDVFLQRLGDKVDLSNTILVFTGDHGESFGEFGYSFHSNSVILPQMQVPFMLSHPKLGPKILEHSCHFDLFPTFFDLLGLEYEHSSIGSSLGLDDRPFAYFFHSATLKGNAPANFGFIDEGELLWVDRLFNQTNLIKSGRTKVGVLGIQQDYTKFILGQMLVTRKIMCV
jgi:phosphoglycerol transferase MdoB-like AlkP superfamily enzyme